MALPSERTTRKPEEIASAWARASLQVRPAPRVAATEAIDSSGITKTA